MYADLKLSYISWDMIKLAFYNALLFAKRYWTFWCITIAAHGNITSWNSTAKSFKMLYPNLITRKVTIEFCIYHEFTKYFSASACQLWSVSLNYIKTRALARTHHDHHFDRQKSDNFVPFYTILAPFGPISTILDEHCFKNDRQLQNPS